jgi:hypothetical protein
VSKESEQMFEEFDRLGLSADERRRHIIAKHTVWSKNLNEPVGRSASASLPGA